MGSASCSPRSASGVAIPPPHQVTTVEGLTEYKLANGMRVLLFPDDSQSTVTVNVTYFVGSRHEGYGETGMAHLVEHMAFKGTATRENIWKELQDHGARFNGTTWVDRTNYFETLLASEENLKWAITMEADRMVNSQIAPAELAKEFSVVRNEFEAGENNALEVLKERIDSTAYLWHNYGKSTIGNRSDIEKVPAPSLRKFYEKYYQPDNAMLVLAGRFDGDKALALINRTFGAIAKPTRVLENTYTVEPVQDGERDVTLRRVGSVQAFGVVYHTVAAMHEDAVALKAADHVLTNRPSGRLYKALVEKKKASKITGSTFPFHDASTSQFLAEVPVGKNLAAVEKEMLAILEGFAKTKITDAEVNRYKTKALKDWELAFTDSSSVAVFISEFAAMGDWRTVFVYRDRLEKLTTADVKRVAAKYFKRSNRTTGRFIPTAKPNRAPEVEAPNVTALVDGYKGRGKVAAGEKFEATLANIERRTERVVLANGMKVALLAKKTRGKAVRAEIVLRFARERDLKGKATVTEMLPQMLLRGTKTKSYQQIRDAFDEKKADVRFGGGGGLGGSADNELKITVKTTNENLPAVIELITEVLTQPSFPAAQFTILRDEAIASLEKQQDNPQVLGIFELIRKINPYPKNNVRYTPSIKERIARLKKLKLADMKKFHRSFYGASHGEMAIVGDFDPAQIKASLEKHLGAFTTKAPYARIASPYIKHKPGSSEVDTPDKKMAMVVAAHTIKLADTDKDFAALEIAAYILGGGGASRLMTRLRHKGGLSYGAGSALNTSSHEPSGAVVIYAIAAPENSDKAMAAMVDEVAKLVAKGVTDTELTDAIKAYLEQRKGSLSEDNEVASMLASQLELKRTAAYAQELEAKVAKLTVADVNAAIKKHVSSTRLVKILAGDLSKRKK